VFTNEETEAQRKTLEKITCGNGAQVSNWDVLTPGPMPYHFVTCCSVLTQYTCVHA
jgi:hypothetical protein